MDLLPPGGYIAGVETAVPTIYAPPVTPIRLSFLARLLCLGMTVGCVVLGYTAWRLAPSQTGVGTHRGMGLLECSMLQTTGIPCPSCGMTTSFAWFFKGNLLASAYVQPCGFVLAYLTLVVGAGALYEAVTGRPVHRMLRMVSARAWVIAGVSALAFGWGWKIILQRYGVDGW